jgi:hypothetical protein
VKDPKLSVKDPKLSVKDPKLSAKDPKLSVKDSKLSVKDPKLSVKDPKLSAKDPKLSVKDPKLSCTDAKLSCTDAKLSCADPKLDCKSSKLACKDPKLCNKMSHYLGRARETSQVRKKPLRSGKWTLVPPIANNNASLEVPCLILPADPVATPSGSDLVAANGAFPLTSHVRILPNGFPLLTILLLSLDRQSGAA